MSDEEELDIVRSLELTAEGSYDDGYAAGLAAADERARELVEMCKAASHALRSYQYGNTSIDLAKEIADRTDAAIRKHGKE